jgi:hypothetical protein
MTASITDVMNKSFIRLDVRLELQGPN